jgi:hypothetical protein
MGWRFRRSFRLLPGLRFNVSKSGTSWSIGDAPVTVNVSKRGIRHTLSIPGAGLSYSALWNAGSDASDADVARAQRISAWWHQVAATNIHPFDPAACATALNRLADFGLSDRDLPLDLLAAVNAVREELRDEYGMRLVWKSPVDVPPPNAEQQQTFPQTKHRAQNRRALWICGAVILAAIGWTVILSWRTPSPRRQTPVAVDGTFEHRMIYNGLLQGSSPERLAKVHNKTVQEIEQVRAEGDRRGWGLLDGKDVR